MQILFNDLRSIHNSIGSDIHSAIDEVLNKEWYILGNKVSVFEENFARFCQTKYCAGVGNGLDALQIILRALDIGNGDEVIVPAHTFIATWLAISHLGATPVPVDADPDTFNIDTQQIEKHISRHTKAIIAVHIYGQPANMSAIRQIADQHGLKLIEDAAQAHGAEYKGKRAGSLSDASAFSFYPGKNLGALGDGGAICTDNENLIDRVRHYRNYGSSEKYRHDYLGVNSRLDEIQAAILNVKLKHLENWNRDRVKIAAYYRDNLAPLSNFLRFQKSDDGCRSVYHQFVVLLEQRDKLKKYLADKGVQTEIHYPMPPHKQRAYANMKDLRLPVAESIADRCLSLPIYANMKEKDTQSVVTHINSFFKG